MQIEGGIAVGEASRHAAKASARLNGHPRPMLIANVVSLVVMAVVMTTFYVVKALLGLPGWLFLPVLISSAVLGLITGQRSCRAWAVGFARKALATRGLVDPVPNRFSLSDEGLISVTGRVETRAPWAAVSEVFPVGPYWVALVDAWPLYMPKRFFGSPTDEKAFIGRMLEHMSPEAKARSADAVRFVAS